jgi:hypothetical protein
LYAHPDVNVTTLPRINNTINCQTIQHLSHLTALDSNMRI